MGTRQQRNTPRRRDKIAEALVLPIEPSCSRPIEGLPPTQAIGGNPSTLNLVAAVTFNAVAPAKPSTAVHTASPDKLRWIGQNRS
jgi:hypothetical protein